MHDASPSHDAERSDSDEALLATDEASTIVAATPPILQLLGYSSESELPGRRILTVVPTRYRQAHVAGTTLNATEGRAPSSISHSPFPSSAPTGPTPWRASR
ncbi:hypothetical protein GCM10022242_31360 [Nocardioides panacisoli]|uniref:PAS domain-containing protein n=1 Tax=Nocardioides panacisoli TaxID=627624 RepID=A0ABP7IW04_9ACTN